MAMLQGNDDGKQEQSGPVCQHYCLAVPWRGHLTYGYELHQETTCRIRMAKLLYKARMPTGHLWIVFVLVATALHRLVMCYKLEPSNV